MKVQELRIGNYIMDSPINGDEPLEVHAIYSNLVIHEDTHIYNDEIRPIPLTEEWLLNFGYIHNKEWEIFHLSEYSIENISHQKNSRLVLRFINGKIQCLQFYLDSMSNPQWQPRLIFIQEIKYVHQIQNIFHELTNEELTIK